MNNYVAYHVHSDLSLLDSTTDYKLYIDRAVELNQTAISISEHGKPLNWVSKKSYCDSKGIKYLHSVEIYITESLEPKVRDNMHTILIAKNYEGVKEINKLVSLSSSESHFYYTNRITIDEFLSISNNVITTSACLASPLNKLPVNHPKYEAMVKRYDYLEIQPHNHPEQIAFNIHLAELSHKYHKPLIAGTDAHSLNSYKAECRKLLLKRKHKSYGDEDLFDLTYKSYDELVDAFKAQNAIPENLWMSAIENTNRMAESVEDFSLDKSFKYPILYGSADEDREKYREVVERKFKEKIDNGIIPLSQYEEFRSGIDEEIEVLEGIGMSGFMLSMSELISWCRENNIPTGFARGSVAGSKTAYISDIIDVNPVQWKTVFSRFCNINRIEPGDIDTDLIESDRPKIFEYIINRFGEKFTARVASYGTIQELGTIDDIGGALRLNWNEAHGYKPDDNTDENPYALNKIDRIKKSYSENPEETKEKHPDIFYYFDGIFGTRVSQSVHPAGMVISPITLDDTYGVFDKDGTSCLVLDMEDAHTVGLVKYDFLILSNIQIIRDCCNYIGCKYPRAHEINWNDENVWRDMIRNTIGVFQFESSFASQLIKKFKPTTVEEMSLVTASIRPSGASYREELISRKPHKNPSKEIDELFKENQGHIVYQEDIIKFLQQICGLTGSEADTVRRAIGKKDEQTIQKALPEILEGYCNKSASPRDVAEKEVEEFLQILKDSASYGFGYNHSISYCLLGYLCAYYRYYYPYEFITSYLNNASSQEDVDNGVQLAEEYGIRVTPPKFGVSREYFMYDKEQKIITKGLSSIKYFNSKVGKELYDLAQSKTFETFTDLLFALDETSINQRQLDILIKIDFFSNFGKISEVSSIQRMFEQMKHGTIKKIKCEGLSEDIESIISKFGTCYNSKGQKLKSYSIEDPIGMVKEFESRIYKSNLPEISLKVRLQNQIELLGSACLATRNPEDRRKLLVESMIPLKSNGQIWCYKLDTMSIGTGKRSRLTLKTDKFKLTPIHESDIIYCDECFKNKRGYWELSKYHRI